MRESCYIAGKAERIRIFMNFIQLEYFQKTVECRSVTEAAKKLFITQPAVSKQLRLLEEELECKLFQRKGNRLVPTSAGEFFYQRVKLLLDQFSDLPVDMKSFLHHVSGPLRIGCGPYTSGAVVPDLIVELLRRYPEIEPSVQEKDTFCADLKNGTLDIMFGVQGYAGTDLLYLPMYRNRLVLICSVHSPLAKAERITEALLRKEPFLSHSYASIRDLVFRKMPFLEKNRFYVESRYTTTLISYVQRNLGFSIIPDYYLGTLPPGVVVPRFETGCEVETGCLVDPGRRFSPPLQAMIDLVREKYGSFAPERTAER